MTTILAGCGGGYDIFGCIPLFYQLKINKILTNLSFTTLDLLEKLSDETHIIKLLKGFYLIPPGTYADSCYYFPEYELANKLNHHVYIIHNTNTISDILECYKLLIKNNNIYDIFLIDGGCDVFLSGNEKGLATPVEDMMHMKAIYLLHKHIKKYVCVIGMNIDCGHGVIEDELLSRLTFLKNNNIIINQKIWSLDDDLIKKYYEITSTCKIKNTIVHSLILESLKNNYGFITPKHLIHKLKNTSVNISELTKTWIQLDLNKLVKTIHYFDKLEFDMTPDQIDSVIEEYIEKI